MELFENVENIGVILLWEFLDFWDESEIIGQIWEIGASFWKVVFKIRFFLLNFFHISLIRRIKSKNLASFQKIQQQISQWPKIVQLRQRFLGSQWIYRLKNGPKMEILETAFWWGENFPYCYGVFEIDQEKFWFLKLLLSK